MTEPERKRQRTTVADDIVGLELTDAGRVFNVPLSTLRNASGYFAARFGEASCIPPGSERVDENGRSIYYIPGDTDLFKNHILPFLLKNEPGRLPPFSEDPMLWRQLRSEAEFFAMDSLTELLYVTKACPRDDLQGRGVLYWLGTGKEKHEYRNPHSIGAVHVGGWVDMTKQQVAASSSRYRDLTIENVIDYDLIDASSTLSRQALVEHRPPVKGLSGEEKRMFDSLVPCRLLYCDIAQERLPIIVDLKLIMVRPTAYSLRFGNCNGMSDWDFEASKDGSNWDVLHQARGDRHLLRPDSREMALLKKHFERPECRDMSEREKADALLQHVERLYRHTWDVASSSFYRYFRLIGLGNAEDIKGISTCLHGTGLELYGDVHED